MKKHTFVYYGIPGKSGRPWSRCVVWGYYFIESVGIGPLGKEPYRIKLYHRRKMADELWKNLQAVQSDKADSSRINVGK